MKDLHKLVKGFVRGTKGKFLKESLQKAHPEVCKFLLQITAFSKNGLAFSVSTDNKYIYIECK